VCYYTYICDVLLNGTRLTFIQKACCALHTKASNSHIPDHMLDRSISQFDIHTVILLICDITERVSVQPKATNVTFSAGKVEV